MLNSDSNPTPAPPSSNEYRMDDKLTFPLTPSATSASIADSSTLGNEERGNELASPTTTHLFQSLSCRADPDLPHLPSAQLLSEILGLYFEKVASILSIIHPKQFYIDFNSFVSAQQQQQFSGVKAPPAFSFGQKLPAINQALLFSMLACAAPYHPKFSGAESGEFIQRCLFERARRSLLETCETFGAANLKASITLAYFAVTHKLWQHAYFFHGYNITCCRYLSIPTMDMAKLNQSIPMSFAGAGVSKSEEDLIHAEELRRCFWTVRQNDVSGSSASKRVHYFQDPSEFAHLSLPLSESTFYQADPSTYPHTPSITQFLDPNIPPNTTQFLDPRSCLVALLSIFGRVTDIRRAHERLNLTVADPSSPYHPEYVAINRDLNIFLFKLPEGVKLMNAGSFPREWNAEMENWAMLLIIYHSTLICLHGPEYNMMTLGQELFPPTTGAPMAYGRFVREASILDNILNSWEKSESFILGLQHAEQATKLIEVKLERGLEVGTDDLDTPFFSYCCCQVGLINLIAVRQLVLLRDPKASEISLSLENRAGIVLKVLGKHATSFAGSAIGQGLLGNILKEITAGKQTMRYLDEGEKAGVPTQNQGSLVYLLLSAGISDSTKVALEEPGRCAGELMTPGKKVVE